VRQINFGLDLVAVGARSFAPPCAGRGLGVRLEMRTYLLGFIDFERTRVSLLLGYTDGGEYVENSFAFYF
jgi:hypothetical protein